MAKTTHLIVDPPLPTLNGIPEELLLKIAKRISSGQYGQDSILSFCKVSRNFRRIGEEVLYTQPSVGPKLVYNQKFKQEPWIIAKFLRTTIQRPTLRKFIKRLDFQTSHKEMNHVAFGCSIFWNQKQCDCGWDVLRTSIKLFSKDQGFNNEDWMDMIECGYKPSYIGLILSAAPNLLQLDLDSSICTEGQFYAWGNIFDPGIPSFSKVECIQVTGPIPWPIICLPALKCVQFDLYNS
jgi:hypothetical protein